MPRILTPTEGPPFVHPFGYDGSDFWGFRMDVSGLLTPALRTSHMVDRLGVNATIYYAASLGTSAFTVRATYTVPANKWALIGMGFISLGLPAGAGLVRGIIQTANYWLMAHYVDTATTIYDRTRTFPLGHYIPAGTVVNLVTENGTAGNIAFNIVCCILEFSL